jgi:hypothetical protein
MRSIRNGFVASDFGVDQLPPGAPSAVYTASIRAESALMPR